MSSPRSIYVASMSPVFHFQPHFPCSHHINSFKQTYLLFIKFLKYLLYYFWMKTWMKKVNNFLLAKVQPKGVA